MNPIVKMPDGDVPIIGKEQGLAHAMSLTDKLKNFSPVLITGEPGTGKELIARYMGDDYVFLDVSDLLGTSQKERILASKIILNDIHKLTPYQHSGLVSVIHWSKRLIAITEPRVHARENQKIFPFNIYIPSLTERGDIDELVEFYFNQYLAPDTPPISTKDMDKLNMHKWPGNVNELKRTMKDYAKTRKIFFYEHAPERDDVFFKDTCLKSPEYILAHGLNKGKDMPTFIQINLFSELQKTYFVKLNVEETAYKKQAERLMKCSYRTILEYDNEPHIDAAIYKSTALPSINDIVGINRPYPTFPEIREYTRELKKKAIQSIPGTDRMASDILGVGIKTINSTKNRQ